MKLHHFGIATNDLEKSAKMYNLLGFEAEGEVCHDELRNINILFMINGSIRIELIEVHDNQKKSPVDRVLSARGSDNIYHCCYESSDYCADIEALLQSGFIVIDESKPATALNNRNVCFLYNSVIGMIELLEKGNG